MRLPRIEKSKLGRRIKQNSTQAQLPSASYGSEPHQHRCAPVRLLHLRVSCTFRYPGTYTLLLYVMHCAGGRVTSTHSVTSCRTSLPPLPTPLSRTYWQAPLCAAVSSRIPAGHVLFRQRRSVATRSSQTSPIYLLLRAHLQCCGAAVASRAAGGGVASPVSVLTRGSVRGAPFLTNSVLISTF